MLSSQQISPGIWHFFDPLGVGFSLLLGRERALLFDAGYGFFGLQPVLLSAGGKPLDLLLSHCHHDHALGALRLGMAPLIHPEDLPLLPGFTSRERRQAILDSAGERGILPQGITTGDYLGLPLPAARPLMQESFDLGGLSGRVLHLPGHTPGSIALYVEEQRLLLLADSWNPQTWVFFPECCPIATYRSSMKGLLHLDADRVLVSHDPKPRPFAQLQQYIRGLSEQCLDLAQPHQMPGHEGVVTYRCFPSPNSPLIFDRRKWRKNTK